MPGLLAHDGRHRVHRLHLVHHRPRDERAPLAVREARVVTGLVAVATAVVGALWVAAAAGLADRGWWQGLVVAAVVAFAALAVDALLHLRR